MVTGVGAVILDPYKGVLLMHRSDSCKYYPDCYFIPGGRVENGENPETAIRR